jgi:signal transduction histidine kinase
VEFLLRNDDIFACSRFGVDWLEEHAGVPQSALVTLDGGQTRRLTVLASRGAAAPGGDLWVDLEDTNHPLVRVLTGQAPVFFPRGPSHPDTPLGNVSFVAVPLGVGTDDRLAAGLLLAASRSPRLSPAIEWFSEVFGAKLVRMGTTGPSLAARSGREINLLYAILNAVTDPILLTNTDGKLLVANTRAEKLFTTREEDNEGRRRAVALNNMLLSAALSSFAMGHAETTRHELPLVDPVEGADLLFELLSTVVTDPREGTGIVSVLRNVSDLRTATEEIEESHRKLRVVQSEVHAERHRLDLIIDTVADPILVTNAAGEVVLMNTPAEKLFSVPHGGTMAAQRYVRANDAHFSSFVSNLLFAGNMIRYRGEVGLVDPTTGRALPVEAVAGKVLSEHGELTAVVTILHDRTEAIEKTKLYERVKMAAAELEAKVAAATAELAEQNELLRRQRLELEQALALKSQFLANMSHEFRTPLNAILGYTSMLLQGVSGNLNPLQRRSLTRVDSNSRHLLAVINDILDISRIEAGRMPVHVTSFRLDELVAEVTSELEPMIVRSHLEVAVELDGVGSRMQTDRKKLKQIVLNLLSNALKFTHEGTIRIRGSFEPRSDSVSITVEDSGIGIARENHDKVFEDFRQVDDSPTRPYGGTGLGLSICRRLATMLGGRIALESTLGVGSTFTLHVPRRVKRK